MKILLVDDEPNVLRGVTRMIECEEGDWEVSSANSGEEALGELERERFDVIVTDMKMPGMDGAQLLQEVESRYPKILRVVLSGQAEREAVLRAVKPMHQYLSKPCNPQTLIDVIRRADVLQETISSAEVLDAIGSANCLPTLPEFVNELNRETGTDTCTSKSIAGIITRDPVISARVLQLANSSIFALRNPVVHIEQAVSVVGTEIIRSLALSNAVYVEDESKNRILSARTLFDHSFQAAGIGRALCKIEGLSAETKNMVFSSCLLHDVGKMILLNAFPERYTKIVTQARQEQCPFSELEMKEFGASHAGIGGYLLGLWGVPEDVLHGVASHHCFDICARQPNKTCQLVFAANWIANNGDPKTLECLIERSDDVEKAKQFARKMELWNAKIVDENGGK